MPSSSSNLTLKSHYGASAVLLALGIFLSALALGALHTPVLCALTALVAAAAFVAWYPASPTRTRLPATILLVTGVGLTAFTAVQALSLPAGVVRALSPATAAVWSGALSPLHEPAPAWTSLSLDPTATRMQVLRGVAYIAAFLAALRIAERHGGTRVLSIVIIGTALTLAMSALLHPMFGAERVFGIYKPVQLTTERHIAPLLNANHLAAYINIGFCLALGMALDRRLVRYRPIAIAVALVLLSTQLWVASRGGTLAMGFGAACVLLMARGSRRFAIRSGWRLLLPGAAVVAGLAMMVLGSASEAVHELNSTDASKIRVALSALPLALHSPFFGVGRGAFEVAFPATRNDTWGYNTFTHPEDLVVQWVTEWGIPVALLGFIGFGAALRPRVLVDSSSPAVGAWSAIATTALHNLVDFNSEVPAIGVAVAACAAMVVAGRGNVRSGRVHSWAYYPRTVAATLGVAATVSIAVALAGWPHELLGDRMDLYERVTQPLLRDDFAETLHEALLRHPSEAYLPFIASVDASRRGKSVVPWVERALELAPVYPPAHFVLAEQLEASSPAQSRLEYRIAMSQDSLLIDPSLRRATRLVSDYDDALELAPAGRFRPIVLEELASTLSGRLPATRERLDELSRKADPNAQGPLWRTVSDVIADLEAGEAAPWCEDRTKCVRPGLAAAKKLTTLRPGACGPQVSLTRLALAADDNPNALRDLQAAAQTASDPMECWRALAELAMSSRNETYVTIAEDAMARSGCLSDSECADNLVAVAVLEERRGNYRSAIGYYERAQEKGPGRRDIVERVGQLASSLGMHAQALDAYRRLEHMSPDANQWRQLADKEKMQLYHEGPP